MTDKKNKEKNTHRNNIKNHKPLPDKTFAQRNSLLTDLKDANPHVKTLQHVFIATLICLFVNTTVHDFVKQGRANFGVHLIYAGFNKFPIAILYWITSVFVTCISYYLFNIWAKVRISSSPKSIFIKVWDRMSIAVTLGYYVLSFQTASSVITAFELGPASATCVVLEQVRLLMKTHAFVRFNAEKVLKYKLHSDQELSLPGFSKFLYFIFAPTLIYRDEYPRTSEIRWNFVLYRLFEVAGVIFYQSFIFNRFVFPTFEDFGKRKYTWSEIMLGICENSIPGILIFLSGFYLILHSLQNIFAELLRFGDREFYKEWWTCSAFSDYFRTWNVLVHDWLYTYIYKDVYELVIRNKYIAKLTVFIISAVVHEWALTYIVGFFFPALFVEFLFCGAVLSFFSFPKHTVWNILFWYGLIFGCGSLVSLYSIEYFARRNVPDVNITLKNYFIPWWLSCDCIE